MSANSSFKVDPNNFLGHNYQDFLSQMYALALSKPNEYFELRRKIVEKVKREAIGNLYNNFYTVLTEGKSGGVSLFINHGNLQPKYPEQEVNDFCLSAAATLDEILNDLVNKIVPDKVNEILGDKIGRNKVL
jgi:hypothetical protein